MRTVNKLTSMVYNIRINITCITDCDWVGALPKFRVKEPKPSNLKSSVWNMWAVPCRLGLEVVAGYDRRPEVYAIRV